MLFGIGGSAEEEKIDFVVFSLVFLDVLLFGGQ